MQLIDTHAHVYVDEFDTDRNLVLENARQAGVDKIFMPAIDSSTHVKMMEMQKDFPYCFSMMGLHPCSVNENFEKELATVQSYLRENKFSAVGEIGLDFYWDKTFTTQQYIAFERQIEWALEYELPIVIHSRNAMDECISIVKKYPTVKGVFHCFTGTVQQAEEVINTGFFLGIGGVITYKNSGLDKVVAEIGIDKLVLETDAPYLAPVPYRGKRNESKYLPIIAQKISEVTGKNLEEVAQITTKNASILFGFS